MSWEQRTTKVIDHVRANLSTPLSVEDLAAVADASRFHFTRRFKATTGETPVRFVQRARLERAAELMRASPTRDLAAIALEVGFLSSADLAGAFHRHHGLAPGRWDRKARLANVIPDHRDHLAQARATCPPLSAKLRDHPACRVAYIRIETPFFDSRALDEGYRRLVRWCESTGVDWRHRQLLGWSWDYPGSTPLEKVGYDLGFAVPTGAKISGDVAEQGFSAMRTVDVHIQGPKSFIGLGWEHIYERWLPQARTEPRDLPGFMRFRARPDETGWDTVDLDCSIALQSA